MAHLWVTGEAITAPLLNDMERRVDSANLQAGTFSEGPWTIQIVDSHLNLTAPRGPEGRPGEKGDPGPPVDILQLEPLPFCRTVQTPIWKLPMTTF